MDRTPYFDRLPLDHVARMPDPDAQQYLLDRIREPAPHYPPHGERVGRLLLELHGHEAEALLLSTGKHCRSFGVEFGGRVVGVMGIDRAFSRIVSPAVPRPFSIRHCG